MNNCDNDKTDMYIPRDKFFSPSWEWGEGQLPSQELLEVQRYLSERLVHHPQLDDVVRGQPEANTEQGQPDELVDDRPAAHAQVAEQQFRALVVAVQVLFGAFHVGAPVAEQRSAHADQGVPQEAGGHQRLHDGLDGQPVAHPVNGQSEHRRQQRGRHHGSGLRKWRV